MKICAYVQGGYTKQTYATESFNVRQWVGLQVVIDSLRRAGYDVEYAGAATVHQYDIILMSITSDCDWWSFIAERQVWRKGNYKLIVGGAGVLNVRPFLPFVDCFVLGRGENVIIDVMRGLEKGDEIEDPAVVWSRSFSMDKQYRLRQEGLYPHTVELTNGNVYKELSMGCPYKCKYCGYTYQRKYVGNSEYEVGTGLWGNAEVVKERALLDMRKNEFYDLSHLRITAIDGLSERLRCMVAKPIKREHLRDLFRKMAAHENPHQLKIYNIVGYPSETEEEWAEFVEDLAAVDDEMEAGKQWSIVVHNTPFRAMPTTPTACWPMAYTSYRGRVAKVLGRGQYKGNIFYQGKRFWAVEGMGTESLSTVILSAIAWRGTEADSDNVERIARTKKFWSANTAVRQATLEKYFDVGRLFGVFTPEALPTRNIGTYLAVEKTWTRQPWKEAA